MAVDRKQIGAASVLGMAYATGKAGVKPNHKLARELLTQTAAEGDQQSATILVQFSAYSTKTLGEANSIWSVKAGSPVKLAGENFAG